MKRLIGMVVLLAVIVPPLPVVAGGAENVIAGLQILNALRGVRNSEVVKMGKGLDKELTTQCQTTTEGLARVQRIVNNLSPNERYEARVLRSDQKNAMAVPGFVYINDGYLKTLDDDEAAGVMAHEISHIQKGHFKKALKRQRVAEGLSGILTLAGANDDLRTGFGIATVLGLLAYSRSQEYEADDAGFKLAAEHGYKPQGLASALRKLGGGKSEMTIISTHPENDKRLARLDAEAEKWGKVGEVRGPTAKATKGTVPDRIPDRTPKMIGAVAVIVQDRASGGGGFFGGRSSEESIKDSMESALERTGRFTIADRESRDDAWREQDMPKERMDSTTVPSRGKTVGARFFLYVTLTQYQVTQEGEVRVGGWQKNADIRVVKAEIRGKVKLGTVEQSTLAHTSDFRGDEIGHETQAAYGRWTSGVDAHWASHPAGQAVEEACRQAADDIVRYLDENAGELAAATGKLRLLTEDGGNISINITSGKNVEVGDYIVFYAKDKEIAKYKVLAIDGQDITVQTINERTRPTVEPFKIF